MERDTSRIYRIMEKLETLWARTPNTTLGDVLASIVYNEYSTLDDITDEQIEQWLDYYNNEMKDEPPEGVNPRMVADIVGVETKDDNKLYIKVANGYGDVLDINHYIGYTWDSDGDFAPTFAIRSK